MTEPALLSAKQSAAFCAVSIASWWRYHAAAKIPNPTKLGGGTFWNAQELGEWVKASCPSREVWETRKPASLE